MKVEHYRSRRKNVLAIICICFFWLVLCCICDCEWNWNWRWWKSTCVSTLYYRVTFVIVLLISRAELGNAFWGLFWPYAAYRQASSSQFLSNCQLLSNHLNALVVLRSQRGGVWICPCANDIFQAFGCLTYVNLEVYLVLNSFWICYGVKTAALNIALD